MDIKLIIWDLDDTLWQGTLAEGDDVHLYEHRAQFVRAFNHHGLVSAICSKNDENTAKKQLEVFNLWHEFVFPRIAFVPKGAAVQQLITDMQLRPINVLFIDDHPLNLHEVKSVLPDIHILDSRSALCDIQLQQILDDNSHIQKNRVGDYRILQKKLETKQQFSLTNEDFLKDSDIHITFALTMENLDFKERIVELINRSNQLNYTQSRADIEILTTKMMAIMDYESCSVFAWDKYGYYGLVGFAMIDRRTQIFEHLVFSCRVMHMGMEMAILNKIKFRHPDANIYQLKIPLNKLSGDWLVEEKFYEPVVRDKIRLNESTIQKEIKIKISFTCMSAGIAYYSKYREIIDFDGAKFDQPTRYLCISNLWQHHDEVIAQRIPDALVYSAAIDYFDSAWLPDRLPLNEKNFEIGLRRFCDFFSQGSRRLLVMLPPENLPADCYRISNGNTREITVCLNRLWRIISVDYSFITLIELTDVATVNDLADPAHYNASFLQKIAQYVDMWYELVEKYTQLLPHKADNDSINI